MEEEIVLHDSDEAAKLITVTGWVSRKGHFYGDNEDAARYDGCTHRKCADCENNTPKHRVYCDHCALKKDIERWSKRERKEWNGTDALYSEYYDEYFFDYNELACYCDEHGTDPQSMMLVICDPVYLSKISEDYWSGDLPEDGDLPESVADALDVLNKAIRDHGLVSWTPGKFAPTDESIRL